MGRRAPSPPPGRSAAAERRARALCGRLRRGAREPGPVVEALRALGDAAVPALAALAAERAAGYAFAVRLLAASTSRAASEALARVVADPGTRDCDRLEAALALDERGDPRGLPAVRALALSGSPLRAAAYHCLRGRPGALSEADLAAAALFADPETRDLVQADLRALSGASGALPAPPAPAPPRRTAGGRRRRAARRRSGT